MNMKRRRFVQTLAAVTPAIAAAQQPVPAPAGAPPQSGPGGRGAFGMMEDTTKIDVTPADAVARMVTKFFNPDQFAALEKLSSIFMPPMKGAPGAIDAQAPQFLDFLLSESLPDRQKIYRTGLDGLNSQAKKHFSQPFAKLSDDQAVQLLEPLKKPWTYDPPSDPVEHFLRVAKQDIRAATTNSREYVMASGGSGGGGGRRGGGGTGLYWLSLDQA